MSSQAEASAASAKQIALFDLVGPVLCIIGLALIIWAFVMDPTISVPVEQPPGLPWGPSDLTQRINNTGLLNRQLMMAIVGSGLLVSGSIFATRRRL